ncbi:MAG: PHP domain-containing protein [Armatimonadota bacterium]
MPLKTENAQIKRAMHVFPKVGKYEVLCGDFHIHTKYSDGKPSPADRVREAWEYGYDALAITDHGNFKSYEEAKPIADALGLILIRGLETGMAGKEHMVALGVNADYKPIKPHAWDLTSGDGKVHYRDELRKLAKMGASVVYAHPHVGFEEAVRWGVDEGIIHGLEVKNTVVGSGWNTIQSHGTWCYPNGFKWAMENDITVFANSDAHAVRADYGGLKERVVTLVLVKKRTNKAVMDAFRNHRTIAWFNGMLWGKETILKDLMQSMIKVQQTVGTDSTAWITIENLGPVSLQLSSLADGANRKPASLGPYEKLLINRTAAVGELGIKWDNVWVNPETNLFTSYRLGDESE